MLEADLLQQLAKRTITKEQLLNSVERDFELLPIVISGVSSSKAAIRYGCAKVLLDFSEKHPEQLYPQMDSFVSLLDSKYRILVWSATTAIANLCAVDVNKEFDAVFDRYFALLADQYLVTVANVVGNSGKIALSKPYLMSRITNELLHVDKIVVTNHLTDECKKVIAEKAITTFDKYFDKMNSDDKAKVISFVKKHANSSRVSLAKKAELFLRRWSS